MSHRRDNETGLKLPRSEKKRAWKRWQQGSGSNMRNPIRFENREKVYAKKFGITEKEDEFSYTG